MAYYSAQNRSLDKSSISMDIIYKFNQSLVERIRRNLSRFDVVELSLQKRKHAAVAFTLVDRSGPHKLDSVISASSCYAALLAAV